MTEKVSYWVRISARGSAGHGSIPRPDNAAARIARALGRIAAYESPIKLTPPAERYFKDIATREPDARHRRWLADPAAALRDPTARAWLTSNLYYNAILRNTISITVMRGSDKTNIIPAEASAELDVRLLPGERPADFIRELGRVIGDSGVEITPLRPEREATTSPLDGPLIEAIREAVQVMEPGALITTPMLAGYTDSYYYRSIGIGAYGISPFRLSEEDSRTVHGHDERVTVENLRFGVEFSIESWSGWRDRRWIGSVLTRWSSGLPRSAVAIPSSDGFRIALSSRKVPTLSPGDDMARRPRSTRKGGRSGWSGVTGIELSARKR